MNNRHHSTRRGMWTWQATIAVFGLTSAILAALLGSLITASTWLLGVAVHPWLHEFGAVLLLLTIPLLILGGLCFDSMETRGRQRGGGQANAPDKAGGTNAHTAFGVAFLLIFFASQQTSRAQQTIFNVPSTDVLNRGQVYGELDVSVKPNNAEALNRFSSFVPRVVVGVGGRAEVGLNLLGNVQPGADATTLVPTVKYKLYDGGDNGFRLVVGDNLYVPVRRRAYDVGNYVYLNGSKTIGKTRLTAGAFHYSRDVVAAHAQRAGGQFGFEQTINARVTLAADWITGKHANGYFTPGVIFKPAARITGYAGYSIGNAKARQGNRFFLLEIGYNFN